LNTAQRFIQLLVAIMSAPAVDPDVTELPFTNPTEAEVQRATVPSSNTVEVDKFIYATLGDVLNAAIGTGLPIAFWAVLRNAGANEAGVIHPLVKFGAGLTYGTVQPKWGNAIKLFFEKTLGTLKSDDENQAWYHALFERFLGVMVNGGLTVGGCIAIMENLTSIDAPDTRITVALIIGFAAFAIFKIFVDGAVCRSKLKPERSTETWAVVYKQTIAGKHETLSDTHNRIIEKLNKVLGFTAYDATNLAWKRAFYALGGKNISSPGFIMLDLFFFFAEVEAFSASLKYVVPHMLRE
jgi:hypothetical protein